jgi:phosphoribosylformimino-5-aminoimidazole carboxamide ribotide isomerase
VQIFPAIDIKRGKTTYLLEGKAHAPRAVAERFLADGATWLHVVDLDRAFDTGRDNAALVSDIARIPGASVQLGGLLRTTEQVRQGLDAGVKRVVVATLVLLDPALLEAILESAGADQVAVAIDARKGKPVLRGASQALRHTAADLASRARTAGIRTVVFRDLDRDGQLTGFDTENAALLVPLGLETVISGGGASLDDLRAARTAGLSGAIVGRALYEMRFTVKEAIACSRS